MSQHHVENVQTRTARGVAKISSLLTQMVLIAHTWALRAVMGALASNHMLASSLAGVFTVRCVRPICQNASAKVLSTNTFSWSVVSWGARRTVLRQSGLPM